MLDRFEARLQACIGRYRGSREIADMLLYHFGYGEYGPARKGKRLRPSLVMRVALAEGGDLDGALGPAAAIEILHNYSLVHDDVEDRDPLRHGRQTLWSRNGVASAVNAGDALCALSVLALAEAAAQHPSDRVLRMIGVLHGAHLVMCDGQSLDLSFERSRHVPLEQYDRMIAAKTAALFGAACELGALCASCDDATAERYRKLGRAYGMAFQIRDDVLGIWASSDATGKVVGNDIARRKWTFPVAWALQTASSPERERIAAAYASLETLDAPMVTAVIAALDAVGAREAAERALAEHLALVRHHPVAGVRDFLLGTLSALPSS